MIANRLRVFVRQPFTETSSKGDLTKIMGSLLKYKRHPMEVLPYSEVGEGDDFRETFQSKTGIKFTPENFRNYRLDAIRKSNAMFIMRNNLSESTAFELGYIYSKFPHLPLFFAIDAKHPIKTTLLRDLHPNTVYCTYNQPEDVEPQLHDWLDFVARSNNVGHGCSLTEG